MPVSFNIKKILINIRDLITETFNKALEDDIMTLGAAIAFYTIFSIAPLFILIIFFSSMVFSEEMISGQLMASVEDLVGQEIALNLQQYASQTSNYDSGILTPIIASVIILFGATTVITQLKLALNKIWNVGQIKIHTAWHFLINRLLSIGMIIIFSLLLLVSLMAEGIIGILSALFLEMMPNIPFDFYQYLMRMTTLGFAVIFFTLIFKILPDVHASWKDVLVGATVTTLLFLLGKFLIGIYLSSPGIGATYRAAGTLVILVIWVYYNVQTVLLGAVFTQVYTDKFGDQILPYRFVEFRRKKQG
ncbi:MAG: YihY/virulence factor BrkB family protein [Balneolaceae bacterium]